MLFIGAICTKELFDVECSKLKLLFSHLYTLKPSFSLDNYKHFSSQLLDPQRHTLMADIFLSSPGATENAVHHRGAMKASSSSSV